MSNLNWLGLVILDQQVLRMIVINLGENTLENTNLPKNSY